MARKCFLSFHYKPDCWRVSQVKNMGKIEGQSILSSNSWEEVKKKGDAAIKKWIDDNMSGKSCQCLTRLLEFCREGQPDIGKYSQLHLCSLRLPRFR